MVTKSHAARLAADRGTPDAGAAAPSTSPADESIADTRSAPPVARVGFGGVQASIWKKTGDRGDFYTATFERRYQEGSEWKSSHSYGANDLLALQKTADLAVNKIIELQQGRGRAV